MLKESGKPVNNSEITKTQVFEYLREVFQELVRLEGKLTAASDKKQPRSDGISAFTFFKFSKLPRLISDALFRSTSEKGVMTLPEFQRIFEILAFGEPKQQIALIYMLLDADKDVLINREDCRLILSQLPISSKGSLKDRFLKQCQAQQEIDSILNQYFQDQEGSLNFEKFLNIVNKESADIIIIFMNYFVAHFHILERARAHAKRTPLDLSQCSLLQNITLKYLKPQMLNIYAKTQDLASNSQSPSSHQGSLYRVMDKSTLKQYWYELRDQSLYMYRREDDTQHKAYIYLGIGSCIKPIETIQQSYDGLFKVYGFELITPNKTRKFFHIDYSECEAWHKAMTKAVEMNGELASKYEMKQRIANGTEGTVWRAVRLSDEKSVAIKVVKKSKLDSDSLVSLHHEVQILRTCAHKHIVECMDVVQDEEHVYIVMEHMKGGTLRHYMMTRKRHITEKVIAAIGHQLMMALYYLRQMSVVHRDIKPDNILLTEPISDASDITTVPEIKIMDFGLSQFLGGAERSTLPFGTLTYVAPEVISIIPYRFQVDVYSVGIVLYQLSTGHVPFDSSDQEHLIDLIQFQVPDYTDKGGFAHITKQGREIIAMMLEKSGRKRIRPQQALVSGWLTGHDFKLQGRRNSPGKEGFLALASE